MFPRRSFTRIPWRDRSFHKDDIKYVILGIIKEKSHYDYNDYNGAGW